MLKREDDADKLYSGELQLEQAQPFLQKLLDEVRATEIPTGPQAAKNQKKRQETIEEIDSFLTAATDLVNHKRFKNLRDVMEDLYTFVWCACLGI